MFPKKNHKINDHWNGQFDKFCVIVILFYVDNGSFLNLFKTSKSNLDIFHRYLCSYYNSWWWWQWQQQPSSICVPCELIPVCLARCCQFVWYVLLRDQPISNGSVRPSAMFVPIAIALCTNRPTICVCVCVTIKRFILFCLKILSIINYGQCWTISFPNRFLPLFLHFNSTTFHSETKGGLVSTVLHYQLSPTQTIVNWSSIIYTHMVWCGHNSPLDLVWLVHDKSNLNSFKSGTSLSLYLFQPG